MSSAMSTPPMSFPAPGAGDAIRHGATHVRVTDVARAEAFWADALGLVVRDRAAGVVRLGTTQRDLIVLHPGARGPAPRGHSGLFHVAVHVPSEADFTRAVLRLAAHHVPQSPTDHIFSIATYANDADGLGLEVTFETPDRVTGNIVDGSTIALIDREGRRRAPTEALDMRPLIEAHATGGVPDHVDTASAVGHVHLHVDNIDRAVGFYRDVIGLHVHMRMDRIGMADFSAGGRFPHRWAVNVWQGQGAPPPPPDVAGLVFHELLVPADRAQELDERLAGAGLAREVREGVLHTHDMAGNPLAIVTSAG